MDTDSSSEDEHHLVRASGAANSRAASARSLRYAKLNSGTRRGSPSESVWSTLSASRAEREQRPEPDQHRLPQRETESTRLQPGRRVLSSGDDNRRDYNDSETVRGKGPAYVHVSGGESNESAVAGRNTEDNTGTTHVGPDIRHYLVARKPPPKPKGPVRETRPEFNERTPVNNRGEPESTAAGYNQRNERRSSAVRMPGGLSQPWESDSLLSGDDACHSHETWDTAAAKRRSTAVRKDKIHKLTEENRMLRESLARLEQMVMARMPPRQR